MSLIPGVCGGLANRVHETDTLKPLLVGELDLANEVVKMCNERGHNKSCPLWHSWSHGIDDGGCEVGVEAMLRIRAILVLWCCLSVGVHFGCVG